MTRQQAWDRLWHRLESEGIPVDIHQARRSKNTNAFYLLKELEHLWNQNLPVIVIELTCEAICKAYRLGLADQAKIDREQRVL